MAGVVLVVLCTSQWFSSSFSCWSSRRSSSSSCRSSRRSSPSSCWLSCSVLFIIPVVVLSSVVCFHGRWPYLPLCLERRVLRRHALRTVSNSPQFLVVSCSAYSERPSRASVVQHIHQGMARWCPTHICASSHRRKAVWPLCLW